MQVFQNILLNTEQRQTGWQLLAVDLSSKILNTRTTGTTFQQFEKDRPFRHILKNSADIYNIYFNISSEPSLKTIRTRYL